MYNPVSPASLDARFDSIAASNSETMNSSKLFSPKNMEPGCTCLFCMDLYPLIAVVNILAMAE